jgi:uncharacterized protein (TIGR02466 family)
MIGVWVECEAGACMTVKLEAFEMLFPTPLWCYSVQNHEELNRRLLVEIAARRNVEPDRANRNRVGWQSQHDLFDRTEPAHAELVGHVRQALLDAVKKMSSEIGEVQFGFNGWVNVNPPGGYIGPHSHPNALLSGSYYVDVPGDDDAAGGLIEFVSPHAVTLLGGLIKSPMLLDKRRMRPKPGTFLIFLGTQMHWVQPNRTEEERVSVAFNLAVSRRGAPAPAITGR